MKLLVAIQSTKPDIVEDRALRWCGRLGQTVRVFAPHGKRSKYLEMIDDINYQYYLALKRETIVTKQEPYAYARAHGFDLIMLVPEDLWSFRYRRQFQPDEIVLTVDAIGRARLEFSTHPRKRIKRWHNGCVMERIT